MLGIGFTQLEPDWPRVDYVRIAGDYVPVGIRCSHERLHRMDGIDKRSWLRRDTADSRVQAERQDVRSQAGVHAGSRSHGSSHLAQVRQPALLQRGSLVRRIAATEHARHGKSETDASAAVTDLQERPCVDRSGLVRLRHTARLQSVCSRWSAAVQETESPVARCRCGRFGWIGERCDCGKVVR